MIFTVGRAILYESYFSEQEVPIKAVGGSVWRTYQEATQYLLKNEIQNEYLVYGVFADWDLDTKITEYGWNALLKDAPLCKI